MDAKDIMKIFEDTAYIRTGGSSEELRCARYIQAKVAEIGLEAKLESFPVTMADIHEAQLLVDGVSIPCLGYLNSGSCDLEAPFYYLTNTDPYSMEQCKGKIVMIDGRMSYWRYQDTMKAGALGFVTYDGHVNNPDREIDLRELRPFVHQGNRIPGVHINVKDAIDMIRKGVENAKIVMKQDEYEGESWNVVLDMPGQIDEYIVLTAHYDSTALSQGAYDNMSGSIGLLGMAEYFAKHSHRYGLRFIWCGSEERGLLGSKAYVAAHQEELSKVALNINLDMIGCIMGKFISCATAEEKLCHYVSYLGAELGFGIECKQDVYSSDSTPFADNDVPAVTFARLAPQNTATIHNSYDTIASMSGRQMVKDIEFITAFAERMACAAKCPVSREIPDNMKEKLDTYLFRKRAPQA